MRQEAVTGRKDKYSVPEHNKCVFDDPVNEFLEIARDYDGFIIGSPVHWGGAGGAITSLDIYPLGLRGYMYFIKYQNVIVFASA